MEQLPSDTDRQCASAEQCRFAGIMPASARNSGQPVAASRVNFVTSLFKSDVSLVQIQ